MGPHSLVCLGSSAGDASGVRSRKPQISDAVSSWTGLGLVCTEKHRYVALAALGYSDWETHYLQTRLLTDPALGSTDMSVGVSLI